MRWRISTGPLALALLLAVGCNNGNSALDQTNVPTSVPSSLASAGRELAQSLCQHLDQLQDTLVQLQASPAPDVSEAVDTLEQASSDLRADADQLAGQGQADLATLADGIATAATSLKMALQEQGNVPAAWQAGIGAVNVALEQVPAEVCGTAST